MRKNMPRIMIQTLKTALVMLILPVILLTACSKKEEAPGAMAMSPAEFEAWEIALVEMRIEKNEQFFAPSTTPLPLDKLDFFEGLNYYFPKAELRFKTPFIAEAGTDTVSLAKRKGQMVPYIRRGKVSFNHENQVYHLEVFGPAESSHGDYLWLPFFDATSGTETYGGGRYLDVKIDDAGMIDLDFNYAYNPLCDYNAEKFNCTLPPASNKLSFAVEAGEQIFNREH
jgi:uncharacterized protein (DUF1684 family)